MAACVKAQDLVGSLQIQALGSNPVQVMLPLSPLAWREVLTSVMLSFTELSGTGKNFSSKCICRILTPKYHLPQRAGNNQFDSLI